MSVSFADAVSRFGASVKSKLGAAAISGAPEDQLRAPLEQLVQDLASIAAPTAPVVMVGEATLAGRATRPDYAVTLRSALVGFIEIKALGKGADPRRFSNEHDKAQWARLKSLPNLLYTDGESFALWRDGQLTGQVVRLEGDILTDGARVTAPAALLDLIRDFLTWSPLPPESPKKLAEIAARLCRLLRDEVTDELRRGSPALTNLAQEWRGLLFPEASDAQFADGYAQAVTFGLLMARARDIDLTHGIEPAALALRQSNSLIGTALFLLTDSADLKRALGTALDTLARVFGAVNWQRLSRGRSEAWLYFYEDFLQFYDSALRRKTGSYYTPPEVVDAMVRLTDEALRDPALFNRPQGLAARDVTICDPATGTGTFLLGILRTIADRITADQGAGALPGALQATVDRLIGFELQFGPFAVAQLRLMAEMRDLMGLGTTGGHNLPMPRLFVTDTLGDPFAAETQLSTFVAPIGESRKRANEVKRDTPITVVIGNPPYKIDAAGMGGWVEDGSSGRAAPMDQWTPPPAWKLGAHAKHLKNLYVFFWRWATWKVFAPDLNATTGRADEDRGGIVCFITASGFLNGPGFQKMREELRRDASHIWVIDCSPEGHQPEVATRLFQGVQQPVCIVLAARAQGKGRDTPAEVHFLSLSKGRREDKFTELSALSLTGVGWERAANEWRAPFLPARSGAWADFANLNDLFHDYSPGVMACRTWPIAPDEQTLTMRWNTLRAMPDSPAKEEAFHPDRDRNIDRVASVRLAGHELRSIGVRFDNGTLVRPIKFGYRSFDRQWIIPDHRLLSTARPHLWSLSSPAQIFLNALDSHSPESGPAISFTELMPDKHHYKGSFGGRVFPLWRDAAATQTNLSSALLAALEAALGHPVPPQDALAFIAALLAHPAYTARFRDDLRQPGLRVPLTAEPALWQRAVALGRQVIWLHCYGERFADPADGRPHGPPRLPRGEGPTIPREGAIPGAPEPLPDDMTYDNATRRLRIGKGFVDNVPPEVWAYEVSGKNVLRQWFSYRRRDRTKPVIGDRRPPSPLDRIQPDHWLAEYTEDLLNLLHVLGLLVRLEQAQATLLDEVCAGPLIDAASITPAQGAGLSQAADARQADLFG